MPRTRECDFCGDDIEPGTGTMFVQNDGSTVMFCSSKCEKNADLGREARDMGWTEAGRAAGGKRAAETADEPDEPETEEPSADTAEPEEPAATEGDVVEDTGAAPDLEDAESEATPGPEGEGAEEAAADADADSTEAVDEDADDEADEDDTEEEEAEA